jgi:hypothetical protein
MPVHAESALLPVPGKLGEQPPGHPKSPDEAKHELLYVPRHASLIKKASLAESEYSPVTPSPSDYRPYHVLCDGEIVAHSKAWWVLARDSHSFFRQSSLGDASSAAESRREFHLSVNRMSSRANSEESNAEYREL